MNNGSIANHYLQVLLIFVAAAGLLLLSWPRMRASVLYLPVDTAIARHWAGQAIPAEQLHALSARAVAALRIHRHYRYRDGLSLLLYLRGTDTRSPVRARREALAESIAASIGTLEQAPMKPMTWLRLAAARASLGHSADQVRSALKMSIYTGRVEPAMLPLRLEIGYAYLRPLDEESVQLLRDQTLLTWRLQERAFIESIRSGRLRFSDVGQVLAGRHNDVLAEMETELARIFR